MQEMVLTDWAVIALISVLTAALAVWWLAPGGRTGGGQAGDPGLGDRVLLFDGPEMIDASHGARTFLRIDDSGLDWTGLHDALAERFPGFPGSAAEVEDRGDLTIPAADTDDDIRCEWVDGIVRVQMRVDGPVADRPETVTQELEILRMAMGQAPYPVWRVDPDCNLSWSNAAYDSLRATVAGGQGERDGPMFPSVSCKGPAGNKTRASVVVGDSDKKLWFDVTVVRQDDGYLCYAVDINAVVDAEIAQRNFVQTLAKTFAQLSIGLAIFDRNRQLALFNPALIDLTALPADFLSARPNLLSFFDRLRDQRMMPEPKNYGSWRHQMADLVAAAADGRYQETWTLPSGAVYSVSGRPHPDGAVAFLFEDITAEVTLTRRFRTDLEINQSMLDQLDDAIAVFSENGALSFSNAAYRQLWDVDPEASFVQMTILDAARTWQDQCRATPVLGEVREFVGMRENRAEWWGQVDLKTGQSLSCCVYPISHGATMVVFARPAARDAVPGRAQLEHDPPA